MTGSLDPIEHGICPICWGRLDNGQHEEGVCEPLPPDTESPEALAERLSVLADTVIALQHRNRTNVHTVKGVQAKLGNMALLIQRDGVTDVPKLIEQLRHLELVLRLLVERMHGGGDV